MTYKEKMEFIRLMFTFIVGLVLGAGITNILIGG
ncbi:hypothetical protein PAV_3c00190 [Paenibacillus alvei DSM 29]|nr:hypothetical protein PAV_3c00190 [Paenibacillus alvei DSM 29]